MTIEIKEGSKFGKWTVLGESHEEDFPSGRSNLYYNCKCDCGRSGVVQGYSLKYGTSKQCKTCRSRTPKQPKPQAEPKSAMNRFMEMFKRAEDATKVGD
jgi:hypothetical protein